MRLVEFYAVNENRKFTLEPEGNAQGRLLNWEEDYSDPDMSYQVVAHGDIEHLLTALKGLAKFTPAQEEDIRSLYQQAVEDGNLAVTFSEEEGASITDKQGEKGESDYDPVEDDIY